MSVKTIETQLASVPIRNALYANLAFDRYTSDDHYKDQYSFERGSVHSSLGYSELLRSRTIDSFTDPDPLWRHVVF